MDITTFAEDKRMIRNTLLVILGVLILSTAFGCLVARGFGMKLFTKENERTYEVVTYLIIAAMVFLLSLSITYWQGLKTNYTDCFRVRRGYAYYIRKRSVILYAPILSFIVCVVKTGALYSELMVEKRQVVEIIGFYIVAFVFYSLVIGASVTALFCVSRVVYILTYAFLPWIFTYFASINKIPVYFKVNDIGKIAIINIVLIILWVLSLYKLKKLCNQSDYC